MKLWTLTLDIHTRERTVEAFTTHEAALERLVEVIKQEAVARDLSLDDMPPLSPGDTEAAWEYVFHDQDFAWIDEVDLVEETKPRRIAIVVMGGTAFFEDAENWPEGLELYIADYDNGEATPPEQCSHLNGRCTIEKHDAAQPHMTGHFARDAADAWRMD